MSTSELKFVMSKLKVHFTEQELQEMILEADIDGDGQVGGAVCLQIFCDAACVAQVNFNEFYSMMITD